MGELLDAAIAGPSMISMPPGIIPVPMMREMLADDRTLDALDFAGVRERVVAATHTQRGRGLATLGARGRVRRGRPRRTTAHRFGAGSRRGRRPARVVGDRHRRAPTQAAALGRTLGGSDLRAVGDALAAAATAYHAVKENAVLAQVAGGYVSLRELQRAIADGIDERGVVLDRASPALGRIRRNLSQAQADARDRVGAVLGRPGSPRRFRTTS